MAHALILGMTESGKTTLAKKLAENYMRAGVGVLVLDPLNDPAWVCNFRTADEDEFLASFWASKRCAVFIDEAGDCAGQHDKAMQKTATKGRHWGHRVHYISQRGTLINRTVRDQCSHLFLFATALQDVKTHSAEWNRPQLLDAANFQQGDYFHTGRFGGLTQSNIFGENNAPSTKNRYDSSGPANSSNGDTDANDGTGENAGTATNAGTGTPTGPGKSAKRGARK